MKNTFKILALILTISILTTVVGCSFLNESNHNTSSNNNISLDEQNASSPASTENFNSDEASSDSENSSSENQDLGSNSSNVSSNTSSKPTSSDNSTSSKPSGNTSSTVSKPQTNTSSTPNPPTSSKPMTWKETMEAAGRTVLYDENVKLYYYESSTEYCYEAKFDGINTERYSDYSNWDPVLKMYYKIVEGRVMSYYDGGWKGYTNNSFWNDKYYNGYWKIDFKWYTDDTKILLKEYEYEEDETYDSTKCPDCGRTRGNGANGTCVNTYGLDHYEGKWKCLICNGTWYGAKCHTCPDGYTSNLSPFYSHIKVE